MSRLIYYLIVITMISNISHALPRTLLAHSKDGAIISMGLSFVSGLILIYIVVNFFNKYPGKGLPELMKINTPKWFYPPILLYFGIMWYLAGLITLFAYIYMLTTFLTPEMSLTMMILPFLIIISYGIHMKSKSILHTIEIVFILFIPIGLFVFLKAYSSKQLNWDFIKVAIMNANHFPSFSALTASTTVFMGVLNLAIFNRYFSKKQAMGIKQLTIIGFIGAFILFTTYFLPIGFGGFDGIDKLLYPWISTTDSVRMRFGIIERLVFIFMLFFLSMSFITIVINWHISAQFLGSVIQIKKLRWKDKNLTIHLLTLLFMLIALIINMKITATELYQYAQYFYNSLPIFFVIFLISILIVSRRAKA